MTTEFMEHFVLQSIQTRPIAVAKSRIMAQKLLIANSAPQLPTETDQVLLKQYHERMVSFSDTIIARTFNKRDATR